MRLHPPRVPEIVAGAFAALLLVSLFLPWYQAPEPVAGCTPGRAGCERETLSAFEAFAVLDIVLLVVIAGVVALVLFEMSHRSPAVPAAWSAVLAPLVIVAAALVLWRTVDPPSGTVDEPVFALLGLVSAVGVAAAVVLGMRSESPGWRGAPRTGTGRGVPEPLPVPSVAGEGRSQGER